ncbi:MAG: ATP-binding protein [Gemmataceae bacterium]
MDVVANPFSPGAGAPPPELVGRDSVLDQARVLLGRVKNRKSEKSLLLTGLRGVGKTVLLNTIQDIARKNGYKTIAVEAHEDKSLGALLAPHMRTLLYELNRMAGAVEKVKRGLAVLRSFVGSLKLKVGEVSFGLDIEPEKGTADSGDLEIDLPALFVAVGEAAESRKSAVALFIDELQYFKENELGALIMAMHKIQQERLPIVLLGAGLPILPALAGDSKSYAERLFCFPEIGVLSQHDVEKALQEPAKAIGVTFESKALAEVYKQTKGYPYFVQEWGYVVWNLARKSPITQANVIEATRAVIPRLDQNFFRVRYDRLTPGEKEFLRYMADLGPGSHRISEIAARKKVKVQSLSPVRAKLIRKGMIYSPEYGELEFTVPLFDEFMIRTIPHIKKR